MRAVIFANGILSDLEGIHRIISSGDLLIAADGGANHLRDLGLRPDVLIGDLDSTDKKLVDSWEAAGTQVIRFPARKDFTDLELALRFALDQGFGEALVLAALGARWDQTLANLLLPAAGDLAGLRISLVDGLQEILLLRAPEDGKSPAQLQIRGQAGDTVSLVPLGGDATGVTTQGLEYPLDEGRLPFGATLGISNCMLGNTANVQVRQGILLCVIIHQAVGE